MPGSIDLNYPQVSYPDYFMTSRMPGRVTEVSCLIRNGLQIISNSRGYLESVC